MALTVALTTTCTVTLTAATTATLALAVALAVTTSLTLSVPAMGHELTAVLVVDHAPLPLGRGDLVEDRLLEALRLIGVDSLLGEVL